jgi:hypothetical protein
MSISMAPSIYGIHYICDAEADIARIPRCRNPGLRLEQKSKKAESGGFNEWKTERLPKVLFIS